MTRTGEILEAIPAEKEDWKKNVKKRIWRREEKEVTRTGEILEVIQAEKEDWKKNVKKRIWGRKIKDS